MSLFQYVLVYLLTIPIFIVGDLLWLGVIARNFYQSQLGHLLGPIQWWAAIVFYLVFILGVMIFAVSPALHGGSLKTALILGALFGFFAYATYDLTNLATLKDWPVVLTVVDILWGTVLGGVVASASYLIGRTLFF